jgi:hypothetical protein
MPGFFERFKYWVKHVYRSQKVDTSASRVDSYEREEYLLFSGFDDSGTSLDHETMEKLFGCVGRMDGSDALPGPVQQRLDAGQAPAIVAGLDDIAMVSYRRSSGAVVILASLKTITTFRPPALAQSFPCGRARRVDGASAPCSRQRS